MVHPNFLEFVLLKEQVDPKFALVEKRVSFLFDVQLKREQLQEDRKRCWLKIEGSEDAIIRAKDYVVAVCSGSSLEEAEPIIWNENNNKLTSWQVDSGAKQNPSVECAEVATTDGTLQTAEEMVVNRNLINKPSDQVSEKPVRSAESDSPASDESLRDFAKKLGYTEDKITTGLSKLGPTADKNSLLSELVKAQSSVKQLEEGSSTFSYEKPHQALEDASCLRPIVIDGSNVAMSHGAQRVFSCRGIGLVVDWFLQKNHRDIKVFVPMWREKSSRPDSPIVDQKVLKRLERDRLLIWTPSRTLGKGRIVCYDDRYIIKHAAENDGVIVSNDNFRDLMGESHEWKKVIEQRLLMYSFVDDKFMPPDDPLGRHGPTLDEFLKKGCGKLCPYLRNCTYGKRCRYLHPDRNPVKEVDVVVPPSTEHLPPEVPYGQVLRPTRPLPPCPPEVPPHTRSLPSNAAQFQKPLPLPPYSEFTDELRRVFPPTLRQGQAVGIGPRRSDPTPLPKELPHHVQRMEEAFQRTQSVPSVTVQDQACGGVPPGVVGPIMRRSSVPHVCHPPPPPYPSPGPPDIMVRGSMPMPRIQNDNGVVNGEWILPEPMFGGHGHPYPYPGPFPSNQPVYESHPPASLPLNHWSLPPYPYDQQHHQYPAGPQQQYRHYGPGPPSFSPVGYGRTPYRGQCNGYMRSRAPPIIGGMCDDVTDNPGEGGDDLSHEKLRIQAYEKLCELFPDDVEKVLKVLDDYSDETSVETLTEHMLDDADD